MGKLKLYNLRYVLLGALVVIAGLALILSSALAVTEVNLTQNGSRIIAKADGDVAEYKWYSAEAADGEFTEIAGAAGDYYDLTSADSGKFIKVSADGTESAVMGPVGQVFVFDLAKGQVTFDITFTGADADGNVVSGTHAASNIYVIKQSGNENFTTNIIKFQGDHDGVPFDITLDGVHMGRESYGTQAPNGSQLGTYTDGVIDIQPAENKGTRNVTLRLKGTNIIRGIHYNVTGNSAGSSLKFTSINGDGNVSGGELYLPEKIATEDIADFVAKDTAYNHWNAVIGGDDGAGDKVTNLEFAGGFVQAVSTYGDNCTTIGAGGNGYCQMKITGGRVVAHCNGTGAAIGGGIGWNSNGGESNVEITGGSVYAENHAKIYTKITSYAGDGITPKGTTIVTENDNYDAVVGGVAIGSGSTFFSTGSNGKVTITGGTVEAYAKFGNGIGGGNSSSLKGGPAEISISGNAVVTATSIGGGSSRNGIGGDATVTIGGSASVTLIKGIGGGDSIEGTGGEATVTVNSGYINCGDVIGGGTGGTNGDGGVATITVNGGTLISKAIGGGIGGTNGNGGAADITVNGGTINTGSIGGGDTVNPNGKLGHAVAEIGGGQIKGQFIMAEGTEPCTFTMTGGTIHDVDVKDTSTYNYVRTDGGAIYMSDPNGVVSISGGSIINCSAENGGAIYMTDGECTISGTAVIENCHADTDGGDVDVYGGSVTENTAANNGGAIAVSNGDFKMIGGAVDGNTAENGMGGAIFVSADGKDVTVDILSGSVSENNASGNGGALSVVGKHSGTDDITVTIGVNKLHYDESGNRLTNCEHGAADVFDCPVLNNNHSSSAGGGIYVTGNTSTVLNIYCLEESGSTADGDGSQSNFMKMEGGKVTVTSSKTENKDTQDSMTGHSIITSSIYVTGGQMTLWGDMENPSIDDVITVDITKEDDKFEDNRRKGETEEDVWYKLLYFENFYDPVLEITTGQYKEIAVKHGDTVTISGNIYNHPGYTIKGWNTGRGNDEDPLDDWPQGKYNDDTGWYEVGWDYTFDNEPIGDLTIFAIWEPNGYAVVYDPNVPAGETYSGKMDSVNFTYDATEQLDKCLYEWEGHEFLGWARTPDGEVEYQDQQYVTNLTTVRGEVVTLYAKWEECDHDHNKHTYTYSLINDGTGIKRTCSCKGYSETVQLVAEDTVYNRKSHPAELECSSEWTLPITYKSGEEVLSSAPVNAGTYTASVTANGLTATVEYTIEKADQLAPPKPEFDAEQSADGSILSVYPVDRSPISIESSPLYDSTYDSDTLYRIVYYAGDTEYATEWTESQNIDGIYAAHYELDVALTNYYIQAMYSECANYKASEIVSADSVYFFKGNVGFEVIKGDGVDYRIVRADGTDTETNGIEIEIFTVDGWYFPKGYKAAINTTGAENNAQATLDPADEFSYTYSIGDIPKNCHITLTLPDAKELLAVSGKITEKQIFGDFKDKTTVISRDSAYTVNYTVSHYEPAEYQPLVLSFAKDLGDGTLESIALPQNTTVIMQYRTGGDYYSLDVSGKDSVNLAEFIRMGTENEKFVVSATDFAVQFIIDFSKTVSGYADSSLVTTLAAEPQGDSMAALGTCGKSLTAMDKNTYSLSATAGKTGELAYSKTVSQGIASKWDGRTETLVFSPKTQLPADAHLSVTNGIATTVLYSNANGDFVYSMPKVTSGNITVTLMSNLMANSSGTFGFDVDWLISRSLASESPENGYLAAETELTIEYVRKSLVSLKVKADEQLYALGDTVTANVSWKELPTTHDLELVLLVKNDSGEYVSTAVTRNISFDSETGSEAIDITLAGINPGSYKFTVTAEHGLITVAEAEFYFIVE